MQAQRLYRMRKALWSAVAGNQQPQVLEFSSNMVEFQTQPLETLLSTQSVISSAGGPSSGFSIPGGPAEASLPSLPLLAPPIIRGYVLSRSGTSFWSTPFNFLP